MAMALDIPVIALSQFSRKADESGEKRPTSAYRAPTKAIIAARNRGRELAG